MHGLNAETMMRALPPASLVEMRARALRNPEVLWRHPEAGLELDVRRHAFCLPLAGEPDSAYGQMAQTWYGERYGGKGLGGHGGGVRCGLNGGVQIKGMGPNVLGAIHEDDFFHAYGGAGVEEALREILWGEICALALPYGGVRVHGVIATGTHVPVKYRQPSRPPSVPRVLIVRQAALRPAHFVRAVYHQAQAGMSAYCSDAERTAQAVRQFGRACALAFGMDGAREEDAECLNLCLDELARRFAGQIACAKAKRIAHGALTESNVCLDGRWIDFGRISTVSDYGPILLGRNMPDFLHEHQSLAMVLRNLMFYLRKYLPVSLADGMMAERELAALFQHYLHERLQLEFLKLTGIPESSLAGIAPVLLAQTHACFKRILGPGNREPFKLIPPASGPFRLEMPERMGRFHLNTLLRRAAMCTSAEQADAALREELDDAPLRADLIACLWRLRSAFAARFAPDAQPLALQYMRLNAWRRNGDCVDLFHTILNPRIAAHVDQGGGLQPFLAPLLARAALILGEPAEPEPGTPRKELVHSVTILRGLIKDLARGGIDSEITEAWCDKVS